MARCGVNVCQNVQQRSTVEVKVKTRIWLHEMEIVEDRALWFESLDVAHPRLAHPQQLVLVVLVYPRTWDDFKGNEMQACHVSASWLQLAA